MSPSTETLYQTARALPEPEQVELIEALIAALDESDPQPLDEGWLKEIQRRSAEYDAGLVQPIPWPEVRARLRGGEDNRG